MTQRFRATLAVLLVLAVLALLSLDGPIRIGTMVFLGGIALKAWLVVLKDRMD